MNNYSNKYGSTNTSTSAELERRRSMQAASTQTIDQQNTSNLNNNNNTCNNNNNNVNSHKESVNKEDTPKLDREGNFIIMQHKLLYQIIHLRAIKNLGIIQRTYLKHILLLFLLKNQ